MSRETWIAIVIIAAITVAVIMKSPESKAGPTTMPKERLYAWDNVNNSYSIIVVFTDPQTLCRYLVGYRIGITPRLTRSGKADCPGVI